MPDYADRSPRSRVDRSRCRKTKRSCLSASGILITCFVAGFLGNPSINLLSLRPGQLIGLRPEQLRLASPGAAPNATDASLSAQLTTREWLGDRVLLHLNSADGPLKVMRPSSDSLAAALQPGAQVEVQWSRVDALSFDARSGERIRPA